MDIPQDNSTFSEEYLANLKRFDIFNLIVIVIIGLATFPLALYAYYKLLTTEPFKKNYTFRLIINAGIVEFLNYLANLFFIQCTSYSAFNAFYDFLNDSGLSRFAMSSLLALSFLQIMLSLSVAINRLLFICKRTLLQLHARLIFYSSIVISIIIALICAALIHEPHFSYVSAYQGAGAYAHSPSSGQAPSTFLSTALILGVCTSLFLVTLFLAVSVCTYRRKISHGGRHNVESGLVIVAFSNFLNQILFVAAMTLGTYFEIPFFCFSVPLFLAIASVLPFWFLLLFGKTARRAIFPGNLAKVGIPSVSSSSKS